MELYNSVQIEHRDHCKGRIIRQLEISKWQATRIEAQQNLINAESKESPLFIV